MPEVSFPIKTSEQNYFIKIALNCFEAAYATIALTNDDIKDDFLINLCDTANPNSIIALYHDKQNGKIYLSVDGS